MDDFISRQTVIQMLNTADRYVANSLRLCDTDKTFPQNEVFIVDDMYEGLERLPSAEPQIIRCKDCEYSRSGKNMVVGEWWQCSYKGRWDVVAKDHYCGHAERRKDG